jgi:hypothetical protein
MEGSEGQELSVSEDAASYSTSESTSVLPLLVADEVLGIPMLA